MSFVFPRSFHEPVKVATSAVGHEITASDGRRYIDACGGAAVSCIGHGDPRVIGAITRQLSEMDYSHTSFFSSEPAEALAEFLVSRAPGMDMALFVSSGSEAVEAALKLSRQYFLEIGEPQRDHFVSRLQSYHGNTIGALSVGGNMARRRPYEPMLIEAVKYVSPCFAFRFKLPDESDDNYGQRLAAELRETLDRIGPSRVLAFVAETVAGATAGTVPPVRNYFRLIREICDEHNILLILDEVMCGLGRCGSLFTYEDEGIEPDMVVIAKGLGGGYQPIGAVLVNHRIAAAIRSGSGVLKHGHTYQAHPAACAGALAVQNIIEQDGLVERSRQMGEYLQAKLKSTFVDHPLVGDVRGRGLFQSIEFVMDRTTNAPPPAGLNLHALVKEAALEEGLMVYAMAGTVDGVSGAHVTVAPSYTAGKDELDTIVAKLACAVDAAAAVVRPAQWR